MTFRACALAILSRRSASSTNAHSIRPYTKNMTRRRHYAAMLVGEEKEERVGDSNLPRTRREPNKTQRADNIH